MSAYESASVTVYEPCAKCGRKKPAGPHPHAPHYRLHVGLVDCFGTVLEPLEPFFPRAPAPRLPSEASHD